MWKFNALEPGKPRRSPLLGSGRTSRIGGCSLSWLLPDALAFGSLPHPQDYVRFQRAGIQIVLTLCAEAEGDIPTSIQRDFTWVRLALPDSRYATDLRVDQMEQAVHVVHHGISQGKVIYVHCLAGVERSPAVCIAYLCRYHHLELWEAVQRVKQARPKANLSDLQIQTIRQFIRP